MENKPNAQSRVVANEPIARGVSESDFQSWLKSACICEPPALALELARQAWNEAVNREREACSSQVEPPNVDQPGDDAGGGNSQAQCETRPRAGEAIGSGEGRPSPGFDELREEAADRYFNARPQLMRTGQADAVFNAGFEAAWACSAPGNDRQEPTRGSTDPLADIESRVARGEMTAEQVLSHIRERLNSARMPKSLTADNGAKALLEGQFLERVEQTCLDCLYEGHAFECEHCDGNGFIHVNVPVSWRVIEAIYAKVVEHVFARRISLD